MFDKMELTIKQPNSDAVVKNNNLQRNQRGAKTFFDNYDNQNFDGFYIKVTDGNIKLRCSLHKLWNAKYNNYFENCGLFTISNATEAVKILQNKTALNFAAANIIYFEIGANITLQNDCINYLNIIKSIGNEILKNGKQRKLYVNAKYRDERMLTSLFTKYVRKYYKIYDKCFEMRDRKSKAQPPASNILRIETVYKRQRIKAADFFTTENINRITRQFYNDWQTLKFERKPTATARMTSGQLSTAAQIVEHGTENFLNEIKTQHRKGLLTDRQYRTQREFLKNWDNFKPFIRFEPCPLELEFKQKLSEVFNIIKY